MSEYRSRKPSRTVAEAALAAAATAILYVAFVAAQLNHEGGDITRFIRASEEFADPAAVPAGLVVLGAGAGYDGQFYYRLALEPLTREPTDFGITLDRPAYRQQRILYPLLSHAAAGGDSARVPAALVAVNVAALAAFGAVALAYVRALGRHPLWTALFVLYPGFLVTLARDTTEIVAATLALGALLLVRHRRFAAASLVLAFAAFAKETALGFALALLAWGAFRALVEEDAEKRHDVRAQKRIFDSTDDPRGSFSASSQRTRDPRYLFFLLPPLAHLAWQAYLAGAWQSAPAVESAGANLVFPFLGLLAAAWWNALRDDLRALLFGPLLLFVLVVVVASAAVLVRARALGHEKLAWIAYLGLVILLEPNFWTNGAGLLRATSELYLASGTVALGAGVIAPAAVTAAAALLWVLLVLVRVAV